MNNNYSLIAIGYPLGLSNTEEGLQYKIEVNDKIINLNELEFYIWQFASTIESVEIACEKFKDIANKGEEEFLKTLAKLKKNNLIVEINIDSIQDDMLILNNLRFYRQGVGIGINSIESDKFKILSIDEVDIEIFEYLIWVSGNGIIRVSDIIEEIKDQFMDILVVHELISKSILSLYKKNLIIFKG